MLELTTQPLSPRDEVRQAQDMDTGRKLFDAGLFIDHCTTADQRRGWREAMSAFVHGKGMRHLVRTGAVR